MTLSYDRYKEFKGKQTEEQLNSYQRSKLSICRSPGVTIFIPGFYIEDMKIQEWASRGLHGDTTLKLFNKKFYDGKNFDWSKTYSVTPKSKLVSYIIEWLIHPQTFPNNLPIIVSSDRQYRRWELRKMVEDLEPFNDETLNSINCFPSLPEKIYLNFHHATNSQNKFLYISDEDIVESCNQASKFLK